MPASPRLLIVAPSAYTLGGLATWLDYLLPGLCSLGWEVVLGLVSGPRHHRVDAYLKIHPFEPCIPIKCRTGTFVGRTEAVKDALLHTRPDIVLTVNVPDAIVGAALVRERHSVPLHIVMSCHGIQQDLFHDMCLLSPALDAAVCTNRLACSLAREIGGLQSPRIFYARYGVPFGGHHQKTAGQRRSVIAWVGRLEQQQKRVLDLPEIAAHLSRRGQNARFLVAGTGPEESTLKELVDDMGLSDSFEFLGYVSPQRIARDVYSRSDAFLLTSSWETGPIVIWESMAAGTPVVTSGYLGSGREGLLRDGMNCLMFEPGNCNKAAEQLGKLLESVDLQEQLKAAGNELVESELNCTNSILSWDRALRSVLAKAASNQTLNTSMFLKNKGRLDGLVGNRNAEVFRRVLGRSGPDAGPSGEWPHTLAGDRMNEEEFQKLSRYLDAGPADSPLGLVAAGMNPSA